MRSTNQAAQAMMNLSSGASSASSAILDSAGGQNLYLYSRNDGNQEDEEGVYSQEEGSQEERGLQEECSQECSQKGPQEGGLQEGDSLKGGSLKGGLLKGDAQILKDLNSSLNLSNSSK